MPDKAESLKNQASLLASLFHLLILSSDLAMLSVATAIL